MIYPFSSARVCLSLLSP